MKQPLLKLLSVGALTVCGSAGAVTCTVTATSIPLSTLYVPASNTNVTGTISGQCTKQTGDATQPYIYIGVDQGLTGARKLTRQNGTQTLNYRIYQGTSTAGGQWTTATGQTYQSGNTGGVFYRMANQPVGTAQNFSFSYYFRVLSGQSTAPAGIYDDQAITVSVQLSNSGGLSTGALLQSTSFAAYASIQHSCYFSTSPAPLTLNYTSFRATAATGTSNFALSCTYNTPYTLTIGPPSTGTLLGVNYSLALSAASGTGTAGPQSFTVTGTAAANQSGTCTSGSCTASQAHTVTVGF